eukprot:Gb_19357 [translate_table: standard]
MDHKLNYNKETFKGYIKNSQIDRILMIPNLVHNTALVKELIYAMSRGDLCIGDKYSLLDGKLIQHVFDILNEGKQINLNLKKKWFNVKRKSKVQDMMQEALISVNEIMTVKVNLSKVAKGAYEGIIVGILRLFGAIDLNCIIVEWLRIMFNSLQCDTKYNFITFYANKILSDMHLGVYRRYVDRKYDFHDGLMDSCHPCDEEEGKDAFVPWGKMAQGWEKHLLEEVNTMRTSQVVGDFRDDKNMENLPEREGDDTANSSKAKQDAKGKAKLHEEESLKKHSEPTVESRKEQTRDVSTSQKKKRPGETSRTTLHKMTSTRKLQSGVTQNLAGVQDEGDDEIGHDKERGQEESTWQKTKASKFSKELKKSTQGEATRQDAKLQGKSRLHQHSKHHESGRKDLSTQRVVTTQDVVSARKDADVQNTTSAQRIETTQAIVSAK